MRCGGAANFQFKPRRELRLGEQGSVQSQRTMLDVIAA